MRRFLQWLFSHRFLAIARWEFHFLRVRGWNSLTGQRATIARLMNSEARPSYLNLGSGPRGLPDRAWVNVDGFRDENVDFLLDFSRRLPFPNGGLGGVFCEHVLEHFTLEDAERIACEVRRILKPGGCFRIVVPDAELLIRRYIEDPDALVAWRGGGATAMEIVNSVFRQRYEHQFLYDWATIEQMLKRSGFNKILRAKFSDCYLPQLALDDPKYEWESLYVDALVV